MTGLSCADDPPLFHDLPFTLVYSIFIDCQIRPVQFSKPSSSTPQHDPESNIVHIYNRRTPCTPSSYSQIEHQATQALATAVTYSPQATPHAAPRRSPSVGSRHSTETIPHTGKSASGLDRRVAASRPQTPASFPGDPARRQMTLAPAPGPADQGVARCRIRASNGRI